MVIAEKYSAWIAENVTGVTTGFCQTYSRRMQAAFPELRLARGHYYCLLWGRRGHWWLVDADGNIVDPTAKQFPSNGAGDYVEWDESQPLPTGKCPNCGDECFDGKDACSEECHAEYAAYLNAERAKDTNQFSR